MCNPWGRRAIENHHASPVSSRSFHCAVWPSRFLHLARDETENAIQSLEAGVYRCRRPPAAIGGQEFVDRAEQEDSGQGALGLDCKDRGSLRLSTAFFLVHIPCRRCTAQLLACDRSKSLAISLGKHELHTRLQPIWDPVDSLEFLGIRNGHRLNSALLTMRWLPNISPTRSSLISSRIGPTSLFLPFLRSQRSGCHLRTEPG